MTRGQLKKKKALNGPQDFSLHIQTLQALLLYSKISHWLNKENKYLLETSRSIHPSFISQRTNKRPHLKHRSFFIYWQQWTTVFHFGLFLLSLTDVSSSWCVLANGRCWYHEPRLVSNLINALRFHFQLTWSDTDRKINCHSHQNLQSKFLWH